MPAATAQSSRTNLFARADAHRRFQVTGRERPIATHGCARREGWAGEGSVSRLLLRLRRIFGVSVVSRSGCVGTRSVRGRAEGSGEQGSGG